VDYAARGSTRKPLLVGVSEGAGLSVLAASDPKTRPSIAGVIVLGMPDLNELGWRWKDAIIYVTHGLPREPTFSAAAIVDRVSPLPLAAIHSTNDEFVPVSEIQKVMQAARDPKKLWIVKASNHRFSDNLSGLDQRLAEAIDWVHQNQLK
jgi:dienelactone hydrolase